MPYQKTGPNLFEFIGFQDVSGVEFRHSIQNLSETYKEIILFCFLGMPNQPMTDESLASTHEKDFDI